MVQRNRLIQTQNANRNQEEITRSTKSVIATILLFAVAMALCACNSTIATIGVVSTADQEYVEATFDESDEKTEYTALSNTINLSDYAHSVVNINAAGEYVLSGTLTDGQIVVDVGDDEKVQLYLDNAEITNHSGSAILVQNAEKVVITLVAGTVNTIADGTNYTDLDASGEPDAAIFSHDDLTINGDGSLTVQANYADGIASRDER